MNEGEWEHRVGMHKSLVNFKRPFHFICLKPKMITVYCIYTPAECMCSQCFTLIVKMFLAFSEMGTDLPGSVAMPGAVGAGQVRMAGTMPGRGGKRRSTG